MTMQVGMVGSDGVLLASDTQWTDNNSLVRHSWNETKFKINYDCGVIASCAGKLVAAGRLADEIIAHSLKNESWLSSEIGAKQSIEEKVLPYAGTNNEQVECLVLFTRPVRKLHHFQIVRIGNERGLVISEEILTKRFAGDTRNSAKFWIERYYPRSPSVPIRQLVPLAAQLIVSAHALNTAGISGLEIVLCANDGITRLSDDAIRELEIKSAERDTNLGELLLRDTA